MTVCFLSNLMNHGSKCFSLSFFVHENLFLKPILFITHLKFQILTYTIENVKNECKVPAIHIKTIHPPYVDNFPSIENTKV